MLTLTVLLSIFVIYSQAISYQALVQEQWENFKLEHGKLYSSEEEELYRQNIFMENLHKINEHNKLYASNLSSYEMEVNHLSDLTEDEFLRLYTIEFPQPLNLTDDDNEDFIIHAPPTPEEEEDSDLDEQIDWRGRGVVTSVKNQGSCGSCWSFSAAGALEGQWKLRKGSLIDLSEQNLVDCSWAYGNHGCNGGWMPAAFRYIIKNGGIDTFASYPYEARNNRCRFKRNTIGARVSGVAIVPAGENNLQAKVKSVGPIAIAVQVIGSFQHYGGGVYDDPRCGKSVNHAMLAVGYGNFRGKDYWLIKNSWGPGWGEGGYIKMARNRNNQCAIGSYASYPIV